MYNSISYNRASQTTVQFSWETKTSLWNEFSLHKVFMIVFSLWEQKIMTGLDRFPSNCGSNVYSYVLVCYSYVLAFIRMLLVCYLYILVCARMILVCYSYVAFMYSYVTRMLLVCYSYVRVCTGMLLVCYWYVLLWYFSHDPGQEHPNPSQKLWLVIDIFSLEPEVIQSWQNRLDGMLRADPNPNPLNLKQLSYSIVSYFGHVENYL